MRADTENLRRIGFPRQRKNNRAQKTEHANSPYLERRLEVVRAKVVHVERNRKRDLLQNLGLDAGRAVVATLPKEAHKL